MSQTISWDDGSGDLITITTTSSGFTVSVTNNNTGANRSKTINVTTSAGTPQITRQLTITQSKQETGDLLINLNNVWESGITDCKLENPESPGNYLTGGVVESTSSSHGVTFDGDSFLNWSELPQTNIELNIYSGSTCIGYINFRIVSITQMRSGNDQLYDAYAPLE